MSKLDALLIAMFSVAVAAAIVMLGMIVISILMTLNNMTWTILGLGVLLTIMIAIGIYQFDKHYLN
nr:MAG TPA: hypothetical protein [Caudoviricetes sp.]